MTWNKMRKLIDRWLPHRKYVINIRMNGLVLLSEGGVVCTNIARTDLCGGYRVTDIPTATPEH